MIKRKEELTQAACSQCGELVGMHGEITMSHVLRAFKMGAKWADEHPDDALIMRIMNAIGYEEESWVDFVKNNLKSMGEH